MTSEFLSFTFLAYLVAIATQMDTSSAQQFNITSNEQEYYFSEDQPTLQMDYVTDVCHSGVWVIYMAEYYADTTEIFPALEPTCWATPPTVVHSARFVGIRENLTMSSVTLFGEPYLAGLETVTFENQLSDITISVRSYVTIETNFELFQETDFGGASICFDSNSGHCQNDICWLGQLYSEDLLWDVTTAKSGRVGCQTQGV